MKSRPSFAPNKINKTSSSGKKFRPERHLPHLKAKPTITKTPVNPLLELLAESSSAHNLEKTSLTIDESISVEFMSPLLDTTMLGLSKALPKISSVLDGPIRSNPVNDSEYTFNPFDEVVVVDPEQYKRDHAYLERVSPITFDEFWNVSTRLGLHQSDGIVACISGGPDSMAMARHLQLFCTEANISLLCVTVDHAFRPEAAAEALVTQSWLHDLGIPHVILRLEWHDNAPTHGIQTRARDARYDAVSSVAKELQSRLSNPDHTATIHVLMAHTADDNIETFWLRMAGCSGSYGLAGIAETRKLHHNIILARPMLTFAKNRLYATLIEAKQPWALDPTNEKLLYRRNQVRHLLEGIYNTPHTAETAERGTENLLNGGSNDQTTTEQQITLQDLQSLQGHFTRSRHLIDGICQRFCADYVTLSGTYGYAVIPTLSLLHIPEIFAHRILDSVLAHVSGSGAPTRMKSIKSCLAKIKEQSKWMDSENGADPPPFQSTSTKKGGNSTTKGSPICIHGCIIIQTRHKLTITMQNFPNAPASLCGNQKPLPPYRADTPVAIGATFHWLNTWTASYASKSTDTLTSGEDGSTSELPPFVYLRQIQPSDFAILRQIPVWQAISKKLTREITLALPIIVDENSRILSCPFAPGIHNLRDREGLAPQQVRNSVHNSASINIRFDPKHSLNDPPSSTFVGYDQIQAQNEALMRRTL